MKKTRFSTLFFALVTAMAMLFMSMSRADESPRFLAASNSLDHKIVITHHKDLDQDPDAPNLKDSSVQVNWKVIEKHGSAKDTGAVRLLIKADETIEWKLKIKLGGNAFSSTNFSIFVLNTNDWRFPTNDYAGEFWRTNVPPPFNTPPYGVVDSITNAANTNHVICLQWKPSAIATTTNSYGIIVPKVSVYTNLMFRSSSNASTSAPVIPFGNEMVEATLIWDGSKEDKK